MYLHGDIFYLLFFFHYITLNIGDVVRVPMRQLPSKKQFIKVNHYSSMYGLQHGALAHTEQKAIKEPENY